MDIDEPTFLVKLSLPESIRISMRRLGMSQQTMSVALRTRGFPGTSPGTVNTALSAKKGPQSMSPKKRAMLLQAMEEVLDE